MDNQSLLLKSPIFANLDPQGLLPLAGKMRSREYARGEVIFHQDNPGDRLYIVVHGLVKVSISTEDGREMDLAVIHPTECFGEMSRRETLGA